VRHQSGRVGRAVSHTWSRPARARASPGVFAKAPPRAGSAALSLHDALPISGDARQLEPPGPGRSRSVSSFPWVEIEEYYRPEDRSEEHTSELQSRENLVCRLLLEKKKEPRNAGRRAGWGPGG